MTRHTFALLSLSALTACGFQLRGAVELAPAWRSLYLHSASPNSELSKTLVAGLARNGIELSAADAARYLLYLGTETFQRRNLSIGGNARATEFELEMSTTLRIDDAAGTEILPDTTLHSRKIMTHDPENVSGKEEESRLLRGEMRRELVQQLLRKLRSLAR